VKVAALFYHGAAFFVRATSGDKWDFAVVCYRAGHRNMKYEVRSKRYEVYVISDLRQAFSDCRLSLAFLE
jgi:hypothetical protein